jgi:hypothetical protein
LRSPGARGVYADAPQESSAEDFGTLGITFFARKPLNEQEREDRLARQMCAVPLNTESK